VRNQVNASVADLRPTQITVAMDRVVRMRAQIRAAVARRQLHDFLTWRSFPAVLGPGGMIFVVDDHHIARALADESVPSCIVIVQEDLSRVLPDRFWIAMERKGFVHPVDASGRRRAFGSIPQHLVRLEDDPYRFLAAEVRDNGGCSWEGAAAEILWANFLRARVPAPLLTGNAGDALSVALTEVRSEAARRLPGWKPP
jgi:hypothetical protein